MNDTLTNLPERIRPYIIMGELNQPLPVIKGPFRLVGPTVGTLDADLTFRWLPSTAVMFDGAYSQPDLDLWDEGWALESEREAGFSVPVLITQVTPGLPGSESSVVRGLIQGPLSLGVARFEVLRFSLANFPEYIGAPVRREVGSGGIGRFKGRLHTVSEEGLCRLDSIPESDSLRETARLDSGFVVSHVGEWIPSSGVMTAKDAQAVLKMLHFWFGLLRGAWAGPLFPQGLTQGAVVWSQFAHWKLGESQKVPTWLPECSPLDIGDLFSGFALRWSESAWQGPLKSAISWFVEANSSRTALESKIVLAHVALELLAWVHLVDTQKLHRRRVFKNLPASKKIRLLLQHISVPTIVPDYLAHLQPLVDGEAFDGPGVVTKVRNALVHATEHKRKVIKSLKPLQLFECSQLAIQHLELALLGVCGHRGRYKRRGWRGWKGDDEVVVPWVG